MNVYGNENKWEEKVPLRNFYDTRNFPLIINYFDQHDKFSPNLFMYSIAKYMCNRIFDIRCQILVSILPRTAHRHRTISCIEQ